MGLKEDILGVLRARPGISVTDVTSALRDRRPSRFRKGTFLYELFARPAFHAVMLAMWDLEQDGLIRSAWAPLMTGRRHRNRCYWLTLNRYGYERPQ